MRIVAAQHFPRLEAELRAKAAACTARKKIDAVATAEASAAKAARKAEKRAAKKAAEKAATSGASTSSPASTKAKLAGAPSPMRTVFGNVTNA